MGKKLSADTIKEVLELFDTFILTECESCSSTRPRCKNCMMLDDGSIDIDNMADELYRYYLKRFN
jgi:ABC-type polysaccharide/polyol phosphate transport system ATPase subunit